MGRYNWRTKKYEHSDPNDIHKIASAIAGIEEKRRESNERVAMGQEDKDVLAPDITGKKRLRTASDDGDEERDVLDIDDKVMEDTPTMRQIEAEKPLSVSNLPDKQQATGEMARRELFKDEDGDDVMGPMALKSSGTQTTDGTMNLMQRVKVIPRNPELHPWTEQRTCVLPVTFYLSMNMLNHKEPVKLKIRVNNHYDILKNSTLVKQTVNTERARGLSNDYAYQLPFHGHHDGSMNGNELIPFPCTVKGSNAETSTESSHGTHNAAELRPAMRTYLQNVKLLSKLEQYTSVQEAAGTVGLIPTDKPLDQALKWGLTEHNIHPRNVNTENSDYVIIDGTWTPMKAQQLNVFNDEDKKVWIPAADQNPSLVEDLTILAYKHDMFPVAPRVTRSYKVGETTVAVGESSAIESSYRQFHRYGSPCINLKIELKYYCVYKDLKRDLRYPHYTDTDRSVATLHDLFQKPRLPEYVPNSSPNTER